MATKTKEQNNEEWGNLLRNVSVLLAAAADYLMIHDPEKVAECMVEINTLLGQYGMRLG